MTMVQAPHSPAAHPSLAPVWPRARTNSSRVVCGANPLAQTARPLRVNSICMGGPHRIAEIVQHSGRPLRSRGGQGAGPGIQLKRATFAGAVVDQQRVVREFRRWVSARNAGYATLLAPGGLPD